MLDEIKEYEELEERDALQRMAYLAEGGAKLKQEMQRNFLRYSMADRGLAEIGSVMEQTGAQEAARTSLVAQMLTDEDFEKALTAVSEEVAQKFQWLQAASAKQVLFRCFRNPEKMDAGTQMGIDMFAEERAVFLRRIASYQREIEVQQEHKKTIYKENTELKCQLVEKLQEIRQLKYSRELQHRLLEDQHAELSEASFLAE
jgi:hypothetical protein